MRFPFVTRSHHEEVVTMLRETLAAREKELHRLKDLIFQREFGVQLYDSLPADAPVQTAAEPEPEPEPARDLEQERDARELTALARTRPSQLGPAMERKMRRDVMRMAQAAHPTHTVPGSPATAVFSKARKEALAH
jgi:hypothetical protein